MCLSPSRKLGGLVYLALSYCVNTLSSEENDRHFFTRSFQIAFVDRNCRIFILFSL